MTVGCAGRNRKVTGGWQGLAGEVTRAGRFHLAVTLARGLVAVWVKAMGDVTAAGTARGVSPPPPWAWLRLPGDNRAGTRAPCQSSPTMSLVNSHGPLYTHTVPCIPTRPLVPSQCHLYPHSALCTPTVPLLHPQYHFSSTVTPAHSPQLLHIYYALCTPTLPHMPTLFSPHALPPMSLAAPLLPQALHAPPERVCPTVSPTGAGRGPQRCPRGSDRHSRGQCLDGEYRCLEARRGPGHRH